MKNSEFNEAVFKALSYLYGAGAAGVLAVGIYNWEWYAGFGLVLFMSSLILMSIARTGNSAS